MQVHHAEVGAYLRGLWGFSDLLIEAIAYHHTPSLAKEEQLGLCGVLHVADCLAHQREPKRTTADKGALEPGYLESRGLQKRLSGWQEAAAECSFEGAASC